LVNIEFEIGVIKLNYASHQELKVYRYLHSNSRKFFNQSNFSRVELVKMKDEIFDRNVEMRLVVDEVTRLKFELPVR
jgi:hypothetical protein